jgi:serine/threonine protein kinase
MNYRHNINNKNNLKNLDECKKQIYDKNKFIGKGGQGNVYKIESNKCGGVVLKTYHKKTNQDEIYKEVNILDRSKKIIESNICPHFIYYYDFFKTSDNIFNIFMEFADGDLEKWVKTEHSNEEWKNMIFQFIVGVHVIQKYLKGFHSDLKPKNIFFKNIKYSQNKEYFEYSINDKKYYLKNNGTLFMLADYGHLQSTFFDKNDITEEDILSAIRENQDFDFLRDFAKRIKVTNLMKIHNLESLKSKFRDNNKFNTYVKEENDKIEKIMSNYPDHVKDKFLFRSLLYYCLEEKLLDYEKNKLKEEQIPPNKEITEFMEKILDEKGDIENIIDTYFKDYQNKTDNMKIIHKFDLNKSFI